MKTLQKKMVPMIGALALTLSVGCTVEQTEEGRLPDVDVKGGNLPKYDVDTPDVDVSMKKKTIEVPDVDVDVKTKKAEVSVPDIDVTMPNEQEEREDGEKGEPS